MSKVIKNRTVVPVGDINPDTGFVDTARRAPIIQRDVAEARNDAGQIRDRALAEGDEIRRQAELDAEKLKADAYQKGYEEGRDAGAAELVAVVAKHSAIMQQVEAQAAPQLRDLGVAIARKILGKELEFHPDAVVQVVKQALSEKARQRREIFLRVNPADLQYIRDHKPELLEVLSRAKEIGLREDPDVQRHGVIIETDAGTIDAQLETQLAVIERELKNAG